MQVWGRNFFRYWKKFLETLPQSGRNECNKQAGAVPVVETNRQHGAMFVLDPVTYFPSHPLTPLVVKVRIEHQLTNINIES